MKLKKNSVVIFLFFPLIFFFTTGVVKTSRSYVFRATSEIFQVKKKPLIFFLKARSYLFQDVEEHFFFIPFKSFSDEISKKLKNGVKYSYKIQIQIIIDDKGNENRTYELLSMKKGNNIIYSKKLFPKSEINIYDESTCYIHLVKMEKIDAPIIYGLSDPPPYMNVQEYKFPYSDILIGGGCIVQKEKIIQIYNCPKCVKRFKKWLKKNKNKE